MAIATSAVASVRVVELQLECGKVPTKSREIMFEIAWSPPTPRVSPDLRVL